MSHSLKGHLAFMKMMAEEEDGESGGSNDSSQGDILSRIAKIPVDKKDESPATCQYCGIVFNRGRDRAHACSAN